MKNAHPFMPTRAEGRDPNLCALPDCGKVWNSISHQPSSYLAELGPYRAAISEAVEKLSEGAGVPPALLHDEKPSGPPRDPSADAMAATWENTAAPATHTGRPSMHSGSGRLVAVDPAADFVTLGEKGRGKTLINPALSMYGEAMRFARAAETDAAKRLASGEVSPDAKAALARLTAGTELMSEDHCDHPNGFGPNGCPCGASAPDEGAEYTFRHIDTGKDEPGVRCPVTIDCMHGVWPESKIREHIVDEHGWSGDRFEAWAESVGLSTPLIPALLIEDMVELQKRQAEVDAFLNPAVTVEDLMHIQGKSGEPMDFHAWWVTMADREAPTVQRKAEEYGTNSLVEMGRIWARAQGRDVTDLEAVEIGCFLYAYGKIQRVADALLKGRSPNVDSWHDLTIYSLMVQFSREKGTWP